MTRRTRLENKLARREEWAQKADARSDAAHAKVEQIASAIPFGQPILVGHHSERHARRDADRIRSGMDKAVSEHKLAQHHEQKAAGLASQLDSSIFSDDANAIEALKARIAEREAEAAEMKRVNAAFKKAPGADKAAKLAALVADATLTQKTALEIATHFSICSWIDRPYPAYALTNLRGNITRDKKRIEEIERRARVAAVAEASPNGIAIVDLGASEFGPSYTRVTFAEKPAREVLEALRTAGFHWAGGSWVGETQKLPETVKELAYAPQV